MKNTVAFLFMIALFSCDNSGNNEGQRVLPDSNGRINNLTVVSDNNIWEGTAGNAIRNTLAKPVEGLPQEEPLFSISHLPSRAFSDFAQRSRNILLVRIGTENRFGIQNDTYAKPQIVAVAEGKTQEELANIIEQNAQKIAEAYKKGEVVETMRRINKSLNKDESLKNQLGVELPIPSAYRYATKTEHFFWIRKDIPHGHMNIVVYELPYRTFENEDEVLNFVIKTRDSIGEAHIPGRSEGTHLITEEAYSPFINESMLSGRTCWETKGTWEVKNDFMAGPYVSYLIDDQKNNRLLVMEGFVFKPSSDKRDQVFELESIFKSSHIL